MDMFDVFRLIPDGSVSWIGSAKSAGAARGIIEPIFRKLC